MPRRILHSVTQFKIWLYRRGLWYSPSVAMIWEKGTLFHPGQKLWNFEELRKAFQPGVCRGFGTLHPLCVMPDGIHQAHLVDASWKEN